MKSTKQPSFTINLSDEARMLKLRFVLKYEAELRGLSIGQTFKELIYEAVDTSTYPEEVLSCLEGIASQVQQNAVQRASSVAQSLETR